MAKTVKELREKLKKAKLNGKTKKVEKLKAKIKELKQKQKAEKAKKKNSQYKVKPFKSPMLWKTHSEDMFQIDDPRENKPCVFLPVKVKIVDVVTFDNKKVGSLGYKGTAEHNQFRYYAGVPGGSNHWGQQLANRARKKSGNEWVYLRAGKNIYGPIHPAFRAGYFRKSPP